MVAAMMMGGSVDGVGVAVAGVRVMVTFYGRGGGVRKWWMGV